MTEDGKLPTEHIRFFFLNMNYLWGDWLRREKLLDRKNKPDRQNYSPRIEKMKLLHSVPIVNLKFPVNREAKQKLALNLSGQMPSAGVIISDRLNFSE